MHSIKGLTFVLAICLSVNCARSAPTETETSTTPMSPSASSAAAEKEPSGTATAAEASSMAVSSAQDPAHAQNTSFTCFSRAVGYYADVDSACKVYHFCMLGDYNGQEVYQRISYLCLNDTVFDQQALDCVDSAKMMAPCADSPRHYDESNTILRKAMIGKPSTEGEKMEHAKAAPEGTSAASTAGSSSSPDASTTTATPEETSTKST